MFKFDAVKSARQGKLGSVLVISAALAVLAAILLLLLVGMLPSGVRRVDLTSNGLTELSKATEEYLQKVDQDVRIYLVSVAGQEDPTVSGFLERVGELSPRIRVENVDPAVHPALIANYSGSDLSDNSLIVLSDRRFKVIESYELYRFEVTDALEGETLGSYEYADFYRLVNDYASYFSAGYYTYRQLFRGESVIASAVDYVTADDLPLIYTLKGHGESVLPDGILSALSMDNLETKDLNLPTAGSVPEDADCVLIHAPLSDLSDAEREMLAAYLDEGGNLFLITDYRAADLPNLCALTARYGLSAGRGYLYSEEDGDALSYDDLILANCDGASDYLGLGAYNALFVDAHPIYIGGNSDEPPSGRPISYTPLFQTSENGRFHPLSEEESEEGSDGSDDSSDPNDPTGVYNMGVMASDGISRTVWISSSYFLDPDFNSMAAGGNSVYFLALLEKTVGKSDSLSIASKAMTEDALVVNGGQAIFWTVILVGLIPAGILAVGIALTLRRRRA